MPWLSHPYRRFILLGALLYAGMVWLGYRTGQEPAVSTECHLTVKDHPLVETCSAPRAIVGDTVAIVHYFNRAKTVRSLPRPIDLVAAPELKLPTVARRIPPPPLLPPPPPPPGPKIACYFTIYERMPIFPGCDETMPYKARKACGDQKLLEFIYANLRYPANAREWSCSGMAVAEFVVNREGRVDAAEIITDPGCGLGKIVLAAVMTMNDQDIVWTPGRQGGRNVAVKFSLPVRFKLE